ncbi:MAG: anthranilate synthase component I family protein [Flavobacteriaceae bacterium]
MRTRVCYNVEDVPNFKNSLLEWSQQFSEVVWFDSNEHLDCYSSFGALLAVDALTSIVADAQNAFGRLMNYQKETNDWIFGYLSYDLKNDVEGLTSKNFDGLNFADLFFFQPKKIITLTGNLITMDYLKMVEDEIRSDFEEISGCANTCDKGEGVENHIHIRMRIFKDTYFKQVNQLLAHIHRGDIYEANFCQEFYAEDTEISPLDTYRKLNTISRAPFATFLRLGHNYLMSASPERYIKKTGNKIISQPIKGTAKRSLSLLEDELLKERLSKDEKERAENIMIVDLVRNDLSKSALRGSVVVEELCKVRTYKQLHQMISTVTAFVPEDKNPIEILKETFPMGSMTGAPKLSAMRITEELEAFKRGLYSGAVGYFTADGDFDFNVVIRSILYNAREKYVSYAVGSAITAKAVPEKEYEECLLKAKAMKEVLQG